MTNPVGGRLGRQVQNRLSAICRGASPAFWRTPPLMIYDKIPAMLLSTLCYALWLSFSGVGLRIGLPTKLPLIWLGLNTFILCNPLPMHYRSSRVWLIKVFARLVISGLRRVEVRARYTSLGLHGLTRHHQFSEFWMGFVHSLDQPPTLSTHADVPV